MLGSLHIEMAMVSTIGDWVGEGGWPELLANANVTGQGNNSLLTGKVVAKSKCCHQVTAVVLHRLTRFAYTDNKHNIEMAFAPWRIYMEEKSPLFQYWSITLKMEMALLMLIRSIRSRRFNLYEYSIHQLLPWMFSLDHYHYARWLSIHAFDMDILDQTNLDVYLEFEENGNFVVARTRWVSIKDMNN